MSKPETYISYSGVDGVEKKKLNSGFNGNLKLLLYNIKHLGATKGSKRGSHKAIISNWH